MILLYMGLFSSPNQIQFFLYLLFLKKHIFYRDLEKKNNIDQKTKEC